MGPLRLSQVLTHIGYDPMCICCCAEEPQDLYGGRQFYGREAKPRPEAWRKRSSPAAAATIKRKPIDNPFLKFDAVQAPLETAVEESAIIPTLLIDHLNVLSRVDRAEVDGLPDKAEAGAPHVVFPGQAHLSDFDLQEQEFLLLILASA